MDPQVLGLAMFGAVFVLLMLGFPVAFTLLGTAVGFAALGDLLGVFDLRLLSALPLRLLGLMEDDLLQAIPLFLFLGVVLQRTTLAADLLNGLGGLFGRRAGGLGIATIIVSVFLAPTTGAIGATVLTIGLLALPTMLESSMLNSRLRRCSGTPRRLMLRVIMASNFRICLPSDFFRTV